MDVVPTEVATCLNVCFARINNFFFQKAKIKSGKHSRLLRQNLNAVIELHFLSGFYAVINRLLASTVELPHGGVNDDSGLEHKG